MNFVRIVAKRGCMIRLVVTFLLFIQILFAFDLNQTLIQQNDPKIFQNIIKELNQSAPDYKLQVTILKKLIQTLQQKPVTLNKKDFLIKKDDKYIATFLKIIELYANSLEKEQEISDLQAQIEDVNDNLKDTPNNTTLQLEKLYYQKLLKKTKNEVTLIQQNYQDWLDKLLELLPKIKFALPSQKSIISLEKKIAYLNKKLQKLQIEKERWTILENSTKLKSIQNSISYYQKRKNGYVRSWMQLQLKFFFDYLQKGSQKALQQANTIEKFLTQNKFDANKINAFHIASIYMLDHTLGSWKIKLISAKTEIELFLKNNALLGIPLYRFAGGLGVFLLFLVFRRLFTYIIIKMAHKIAKLTASSFDDKLLEVVEGPLKFAFIILGIYFAFIIMQINGEVFDKTIKSLIIFEIFWIFYNLVVVLDESIYRFAKRFGKELYREIGAFFIKSLKIFIVAIGLVSILQIWDINVSAFLASLGLGGLAFALAAKDTAANLFGGLSILADRALKIDDWIKVGDVEGTVEDIGLRTTKVRTFEKSLITVPNQIIANNPIENFSRRNIRRIKMRIGLVYSTTHEQMETILTDIRNMLKSHPGIAKNATLLVNFDEFEDSSLSIFIYCFTNTADWAKYLEIREDINLKIMEIIQRHGSDFAFPSESVYIEKMPNEKNCDNR